MADDVTDSDTLTAAPKSDETVDGSSECDSSKLCEETNPSTASHDVEVGDVGSSSEQKVNGSGGGSDVQDDSAPTSSDVADTENQIEDLNRDSSAEPVEGNGVGEADSGAVDSSNSYADQTVESTSTSLSIPESGGLVDSSVTENVDLEEASSSNVDMAEHLPPGNVGSPESDEVGADLMLNSPTPVEDEDVGVSSTVQESAEQDQSVPECSSSVANEAMETDEVGNSGEVDSGAGENNAAENSRDQAQDEDSVVPDGGSPSDMDRKDVDNDGELVTASELKVDSTEMKMDVDKDDKSAFESEGPKSEIGPSDSEKDTFESEGPKSEIGPSDSEKDTLDNKTTEDAEEAEKGSKTERGEIEGQEEGSKSEGKEQAADVEMVDTESKDTPRDESEKEQGEEMESETSKKDQSEGMETETSKSSPPTSVEETAAPANDEKKAEEQNVLKDYAGDVMDDFLGMFGLDKLDEDEKEKLSVSDKFSSEKAATLAKATESAPSPKATDEPAPAAASTPPPKPSQPAAPSKPSGGKSQGKPVQQCIVCKKVDKCKYNIVRNGDIKHLCDDNCFKTFRANPAAYLKAKDGGSSAPPPPPAPAQAPSETDSSAGPLMSAAEKECVICKQTSANKAKQFLAWQGMNYCSEVCLGKFQGKLSKTCAYCDQEVSEAAKAKFCMSLGKDVKHFCQVACLDDFKKHLKLCAFCQTDLSKNVDSFAAPVGKGTGFKDFCSQNCLQKYEDKLFNKEKEDKGEDGKETDEAGGERPRTRLASGLATCAVCGKMSTIKHEVTLEGKSNKLCSDPCFAAFRYTNKLTMNKCDLCGATATDGFHVQYEGHQKKFCSVLCVNTFKVAKKKMVSCAWCATKKPNFDMIERVDANNKYQLFCSLNCLSLYRVNIQATSNQRVSCDQCRKYVPAQYHLTMSDASVRNFCSYTCVVAFQAQFNQNRRPANVANRGKGPQQQMTPRTIAPSTQQKILAQQKAKTSSSVPVISNVMSLAPAGQKQGAISTQRTTTTTSQVNKAVAGTQTVIQKVMIHPPTPKLVKNKSLLCKPFTQTKATTCRPHTQTKEVQTDDGDMKGKPTLIPVPVPIYVPCPGGMYSFPTPFPVPIPVPIPVPVFVPTTKKTTESIFKYMQEIQEKMPSDPFEAELLMMAAAVASDHESDSEEINKKESCEPPADVKQVKKPDEKKARESTPYQQPAPQEPLASNNVSGEDMLQMALRLASEMTEPVDLESSLDTSAVKPAEGVQANPDDQENEPMIQDSRRGGKGRKRAAGGRGTRSRSKRQKVEEEPEPQLQPVVQEPSVQPDAGLVLKYTYGVNAWKHWVLQKNQQLEKALKQNHRIKLFKTDILQCTADELNYTLCLFVKEVRKPNGEEYAPDSIYYLCLGIQMYLFENSRVDNIFTDIYYEKFTECLNEVSMRYEPRYAPSGHLICRIEEEHLWECKQLGAHSPHVLLNTLIYFNTRDFGLKSPEEHLRLSFSHIMKHWKKSGSNSMCPSPTNAGGNNKNAGRTVYLRYYAPAASTKGGNKKKKEKDDAPIFEQAENIENPLRCPVKLYEFYLSKCPESIRNRNDVFYLVPERSCVPDSPVWYSTASLGADSMAKMLNRLRMVKEIQESSHGSFNVGFTA